MACLVLRLANGQARHHDRFNVADEFETFRAWHWSSPLDVDTQSSSQEMGNVDARDH